MRTIGVLGGMGPAATVDFFSRLVRVVPGERDQDHPPVVVYNATQIPDRTSHLLADGTDPTAALQQAARVLQDAGAALIVMPCNSAHAYLAPIRAAVRVPVLDMVRIAARHAADVLGPNARIGVLAATGTVRLGLYERALREAGVLPLHPGDAEQDGVMDAVRSVKAGRTDVMGLLQPAVEQLVLQGADAVILGCTELPIAVRPEFIPVRVIDATESLISAALHEAMAPLPRV